MTIFAGNKHRHENLSTSIILLVHNTVQNKANSDNIVPVFNCVGENSRI
jgi:hypothetical protein